ncbi:MAG TPA: nucleotidyltransferase family protein [Anaerolineales bacterium]|nr:nucleotidyltransferase family protein [Anaerolineales bacterium]
MDAIITAGGIPRPEDPLYTYSNGDSKALIDVAGKPMVQWVLDALGSAKRVNNVIVVGLSPKSGVTCKKPLHFVSNQGRMLANIVTGVNKALEINKKNQYVLVVSSDIPTLKPEMVDWLVDTCMETKDDIYYGVCPRDVMEARFPDSKRTYTHLKDMDVCGADINITHVRMATEHLDMWESLIGSRKSPLRQAGLIGLSTLFALFTRRLTLEDAVQRVCDRIGIKGRAIIWSHAEPCMDVDKPSQLELLRADLARQQQEQKPVTRTRSATKKAVKPAKSAKSKTATKTLKAKKPATLKTSRTKVKAEE